MDKITGMTVFTRVAKSGSFTSAAEELRMSRAMVTKHIMHLETSLGVRLLNRTTRRLSLTEVGRAYLERCVAILGEIEETESAVTQLQSEPKGTLRVSAPPYFGSKHLVPAIVEYNRLFPDVHFDVVLHSGIIDLIEESIDLAIRLDNLYDSSLVSRNLAVSRLILCGSPEYLKARGSPGKPEDLEGHDCLVNTSLPPRDVWKFSEGKARKAIRVSGSLRSNIAGAVRTAAINGMGLAVLPSYMIGAELKSGRLLRVLKEYPLAAMNIHAVYPHRKFLSAKVRTFLDFLSKRLEPKPYWDAWLDE
ncbi:MAG: LysR family transcriptional regulator [Gammaproteobacteria bacterium]